MPLPVKLSDALVLDARLAAEVEQRSIAGQVEYWASLGKLVDALLDGRNRSEALQKSKTKPLSELVATIGTPEGDARLRAYLESEPFPHFEPHPTRKGILIRIEADGAHSVGRFVDREFVAESRRKEKLAPRPDVENDFTPEFSDEVAIGNPMWPHPGMAVGSRVRIREGVFAGVEGYVTELREQRRVIIALAGFRQCYSLEVGIDELLELKEPDRTRPVALELTRSTVPDSPMAAVKRSMPSTRAVVVRGAHHDRQAVSGAPPKRLSGMNRRAAGSKTK